MNVQEVADILGISGDTVRRDTKRYAVHLSPTANPPGGQVRVYTEHDLRIMLHIRTLADSGMQHREIADRLGRLQAEGYSGLPDLPPDLTSSSPQTMPVEAARTAATAAVLKYEYDRAMVDLESFKRRVAELETELEQARTQTAQDTKRIHELELQLEKARAVVSSYTVHGAVINPFLLLGLILVVAVILVVVLLVIGRML